MPWRDTADPSRILVSEIMLQQTQAERVIPKYLEFLAAFPTVHDLAAATFQEVLSHWHGLGYNRRARYLHDAARTLVDDHGGVVPSTTADLRSLPGVGTYTAGAIRAFAFNLPAVFVETNIRRVFLQVFFPSHSSVTDRKLLSLVGATLDVTNPRSWYYALMDYGAYLASEFANANHRSAHYRPQTPFAGSVREVRGRIIRVLTQDGELERSELERRVAPGDQRFAVAVDGLVADRMIRVVGELVGLS